MARYRALICAVVAVLLSCFMALAQETEGDGIAAEFRPAITEDERAAAIDAEVRQRAEQAARDDLVAQQSMARSTEDLIDLTGVQIGLGVVESILLVATTIFTAIAAIAAAKAAKASIKSADSYAASERARIHVICNAMSKEEISVDQQLSEIIETGNPGTLRFKFRFDNLGRTPALLEEISGGIEWASDLPPEASNWEIKNPSTPIWICDPGETWGPRNIFITKQIEKSEAEDIISGRNNLWVWGKVTYETVLGDRRETSFCRQYFFDPEIRLGDFLVAGGKERNRRT